MINAPLTKRVPGNPQTWMYIYRLRLILNAHFLTTLRPYILQ